MQNKFTDKCHRNLLEPPPVCGTVVEINKENLKSFFRMEGINGIITKVK